MHTPRLSFFDHVIAVPLLAETEHRKRIERTVRPFAGLLLGLFFVSVGPGLDLPVRAANPALVPGIMAGTSVVNVAVVLGLARIFGLASMNRNLLDRGVGDIVLVASILSMFCVALRSCFAGVLKRRSVERQQR